MYTDSELPSPSFAVTGRALPIGIQTFRKIREGDYYDVDKTGLALRLIAEGTRYFLSRPRRFGKSLFLDTLAELFEDRGYADKYRAEGLPMHLVGIEFSRQERTLVGFDVETLGS